MIRLFIKIIFIIVFALAFSFGIDFLYRKDAGLAYDPPKNLLSLPPIKEKYQLVALGNSHTESGITFKKYSIPSVSFASVSQSFEYDLALLKMHEKQIADNAVIVINLSPLSFSQNKPRKEDLVNMNYYDGRLSPFLIPNLKLSEYLQIQVAPFARAGFLWRQFHAEKVAKAVSDSYAATRGEKVTPTPPPAPPAPKTPPMTEEEIQKELNSAPDPLYEKLTPSAEFVVNKWYRSGGFSKDSFKSNRKDLDRIISYSLAHHWRPVLITLPISKVLIDKLEDNYMKTYVYDNMKGLENFEYIDFTKDQRLIDNGYLFSNSDHLNDKGAQVTSYLLMQKLIEKSYLPGSVDSYSSSL